jgi:DNA-binding XRE family transcriptional regulator
MPSNALIIQRRKEIGLTQEKLAEHIGVSRQTIAMWETGKQFPTDHVALLTAR